MADFTQNSNVNTSTLSSFVNQKRMKKKMPDKIMEAEMKKMAKPADKKKKPEEKK